MDWYEYLRGYDDGWEDYRSSKGSNGLLLSLIRFAFSIVILFLQTTWFLLKTLAGLVWAIVKLIVRRDS